jgi:bifunctional DNA-binding transcriptional regulator/antitoxin component of YhaV-PrlF toxin-antitoxin module
MKRLMRDFILVSLFIFSMIILKDILIGDAITENSNAVQKILLSNTVPVETREQKELKRAQEKIMEIENEKNTLILQKQELKRELISRGDISRREEEKKRRIISALNKNFKGSLSRRGEYFYQSGVNMEVNPLLVAAIAIHETANGNSTMIKKQNNPGGLFKNGQFQTFETLEEGIDSMFKVINQYYINEGRTTIEAIGAKYCPIGAENDPQGLNKHWIPAVTKLYTKLLNEAGGII